MRERGEGTRREIEREEGRGRKGGRVDERWMEGGGGVKLDPSPK